MVVTTGSGLLSLLLLELGKQNEYLCLRILYALFPG